MKDFKSLSRTGQSGPDSFNIGYLSAYMSMRVEKDLGFSSKKATLGEGGSANQELARAHKDSTTQCRVG
jgi:hypothetical protein